MKIIKNYDDFINESKKSTYIKGCVLLNFRVDNWKEKVLSIIDEEDIYDDELNDFGLEDNPHVTVLFGILPDKTTVKEIKDNLKNVDIDIVKEYKLQDISIFDTSEDYDVVKFDLKDCDELIKLNKYIADNFEYEDDHPEYHPHVTIGYVKKGKGEKYIQKLKEPIIVEPSRLVYSYPDEEGENKKTNIKRY